MPPPRSRAAARILLAIALAGTLLSACRATEGDDGTFEPLATTSTDFTLPYGQVAVGNQPTVIDVTTSGGLLEYVAVANLVGTPPLDGIGEPAPGTVSVLENNPAGTLSVIQTLTVGVFPTLARWVDLDGGAGSLDLVVLDDSNKHLAIYLSSAPGSWPSTPSYEYTLPQTAVALAFVNLDSVANATLDLVLTVPQSDQLIVIENAPAGTFTAVPSTVVKGLSRFVAGDFDGDATADLAILNTPGGAIYQYEWNGTAFVGGATISGIESPSYIAAANFDGSPGVDLAVLANTAAADTNDIYLYANDGAGAFSISGSAAVLEQAHELLPLGTVVAGDAGPGLAVMHTNQRYITVLRPTGGSFSTTLLATSRNPTTAIAGDVNGDGFPDIITVEDEKRALGVFLGSVGGTFTRTVIGLLSVPRSPHALDVTAAGGGQSLIVVQPYEDRLLMFTGVAD